MDIDLFEYATSASLQTAFNQESGSNFLTGGTPSASSSWNNDATKAFDGNLTTWAGVYPMPGEQWIQYDLGAGVSKKMDSYRFRVDTTFDYNPKQWAVKGSNDGTNWDTLHSYTQSTKWSVTQWNTYSVGSTTAYRYFRFYVYATWVDACVLFEWQAFEAPALSCATEATIIQQGTYAFKGLATTSANNLTLYRDISPTLDLSNLTTIYFSMRSSRTGQNIKLSIRDSGGTTSEYTPNIAQADTWQAFEWDISAIANADKDVINRLTITVVNADAENTFYLDGIIAGTKTTVSLDVLSLTLNQPAMTEQYDYKVELAETLSMSLSLQEMTSLVENGVLGRIDCLIDLDVLPLVITAMPSYGRALQKGSATVEKETSDNEVTITQPDKDTLTTEKL